MTGCYQCARTINYLCILSSLRRMELDLEAGTTLQELNRPHILQESIAGGGTAQVRRVDYKESWPKGGSLNDTSYYYY